jgi:hypothetical protein
MVASTGLLIEGVIMKLSLLLSMSLLLSEVKFDTRLMVGKDLMEVVKISGNLMILIVLLPGMMGWVLW